MNDIWFGDKRDRVKWGAVSLLVKDFNLLSVLYVAMLDQTPVSSRKLIMARGQKLRNRAYPSGVWDFFSDLDRVRRLGKEIGAPITVISDPFKGAKKQARKSYFDMVCAKIQRKKKRPMLVLIDPDTGITPGKSTGPQHVSGDEVHRVWEVLKPGDVLAIYQHGARYQNWRTRRGGKLSDACDGARPLVFWSETISKDVAMLAVKKPKVR